MFLLSFTSTFIISLLVCLIILHISLSLFSFFFITFLYDFKLTWSVYQSVFKLPYSFFYSFKSVIEPLQWFFFFFLISGNILFKSMISAWFLFIHSLYQIPSWCDFVSISSFIFLIMVAFKPVNTFIMSTLKSDNWFFHRSVCVCVYDTHTLMYFYSGIWVVFSSFFLCPYNFLLETRHVR